MRNKAITDLLAGSVFLLALSSGAILSPLPAQTTQPTHSSQEEAATPDPTQKEARALLDRAIKSQLGELKRGAITSFQGRFEFKMYREKDNIVGDYSQAWFRGDDGRFDFRRTLETDFSRKRVTLVCNAQDEIFGLDARNRVIAKNRAEDEPEREDIRTEKRSAQRVYELFFLNEMSVEDVSLKVLKKAEKLSLRIGENADFDEAVDVIGLETKDGKRIRLWIYSSEKYCDVVQAEIFDSKDPRSQTLADGSEKIVPETFQMLAHWKITVPGREQGLRFPMRMRYLVGDKAVIEITSSDTEEIRLNSIDAKLRKKLFELPE